MNFWQQILLSQASAGLHAIFLAFGSKYFSAAEQSAVSVVIDALIDLPRRIHEGKPPQVLFIPETIHQPVKRGRRKANKIILAN